MVDHLGVDDFISLLIQFSFKTCLLAYALGWYAYVYVTIKNVCRIPECHKAEHTI